MCHIILESGIAIFAGIIGYSIRLNIHHYEIFGDQILEAGICLR